MIFSFLIGDVVPPGPLESLVESNGSWTLVVAGVVIAIAAVVGATMFFRKSSSGQ